MNLLKKVISMQGQPSLIPPGKLNSTSFGIKHYAGEVYYEISNFLEKNKNIVNLDSFEVLQKS
jgi:myosin heavy subunit